MSRPYNVVFYIFFDVNVLWRAAELLSVNLIHFIVKFLKIVICEFPVTSCEVLKNFQALADTFLYIHQTETEN
jgi:hypothetical protein